MQLKQMRSEKRFSLAKYVCTPRKLALRYVKVGFWLRKEAFGAQKGYQIAPKI